MRRIPDSLVEAFTPYDAVEAADEARVARETVAAFLPTLNERARKVFEARFLRDASYAEIGSEHGLGVAEVVVIAVKAFGKFYRHVHSRGDAAGRIPDGPGFFPGTAGAIRLEPLAS